MGIIKMWHKTNLSSQFFSLIKKVLSFSILFQMIIFTGVAQAQTTDLNVTTAPKVLKGEGGQDKPLNETNKFSLNDRVYIFFENPDKIKATFMANWYNGEKLVHQSSHKVTKGKNFYVNVNSKILGVGNDHKVVLLLDDKIIAVSSFSISD